VTSAYLSDLGIWGVRVHDVRSTVDALDVAQALRAARAAAPAAHTDHEGTE
jgi:dihydropteroate synthase